MSDGPVLPWLIARFRKQVSGSSSLYTPCPFLPDQEGSPLPSPNPIFLLSSWGDRRRTRLPRSNATGKPAAVAGDDVPGERPCPLCVVGVGFCTIVCVGRRVRRNSAEGREFSWTSKSSSKGNKMCRCTQRLCNFFPLFGCVILFSQITSSKTKH